MAKRKNAVKEFLDNHDFEIDDEDRAVAEGHGTFDSRKVIQAATELIKFVALKNYIKDVEGFRCPKMRALAQLLPEADWKPKWKYAKLEKESEEAMYSEPQWFFFEVADRDPGKGWDRGLRIGFTLKWEYDTDLPFLSVLSCRDIFRRLSFSDTIEEFEGQNNHLDTAIYYVEAEKGKPYKGPSAKEATKALIKRGFEEKKGLLALYDAKLPYLKEHGITR